MRMIQNGFQMIFFLSFLCNFSIIKAILAKREEVIVSEKGMEQMIATAP